MVLFRILALTMGSFAVGTGAYVVAGVLVDIAEDLSVSVATAGLLISVFAITFALASPLLVAVTSSVARRRLVVGALILFALANVAAALAPSFSVLLLARVVAALGAAVFTPVASAVAASLASPGMQGRALSVRTLGSTVAFLVGVPLGTVIGGYYGWQTSFLLVATLAAVAALGAKVMLPDVAHDFGTSAGGTFLSHLYIARRGAIFAVLSLSLLTLMASFVVLTYVRPMLENLTGFGTEGISLMLMLFGLASVPGTLLGGYAADRWGYKHSMATALTILAVSLCMFSVVFVANAGSTVTIVESGVVLITWSIATFAQFPLQQYRLIGLAPHERSTILSLNATAIQAGQGIGAGFGALILHFGSVAGLGLGGALCALVALLVLGYTVRISVKPVEQFEEG